MHVIIERNESVSSAYSSWFGRSVLLVVVLRRCHVPIPCSIVGESVAYIRVRIDPGWELEIRKELILAIEEEPVPMSNWTN
jgi:hypothetical protein